MKKLLFVTMFVIAGVQAFAQVDKKVEGELKASYGKIISYMKAKDIKGILSMMTEDCIMVENGQKITKKQFGAHFTQEINMINIKSSVISFTKLVVKGKSAETEYSDTMKVSAPGPDKKESEMEVIGKYKSTFVKDSSGWKMKYSETVGAPQIKVNGKPMQSPQAKPKQ